MRAPSRAVFVATIAAVALALNAEESCPSPAQPELRWIGQLSGCTAGSGLPCGQGELIAFSVMPSGGGWYPECVTYLWDFGDGSTSTAQCPSHTYGTNGPFVVQVSVRGGNVALSTGKQMIISETAVPIIERFSASATAVRCGEPLTLSWSTKYATSVQIEPIRVNVDATLMSYTFVPPMTGTYTLWAFGRAAVRPPSQPPVTVVVFGRCHAVRH